jgi:hypothetical protein
MLNQNVQDSSQNQYGYTNSNSNNAQGSQAANKVKGQKQ